MRSPVVIFHDRLGNVVPQSVACDIRGTLRDGYSQGTSIFMMDAARAASTPSVLNDADRQSYLAGCLDHVRMRYGSDFAAGVARHMGVTVTQDAKLTLDTQNAADRAEGAWIAANAIIND